MPKKCLFIVLDGLGDRSHPELGGLTPLQAAPTPGFDRLAAAGCNGLYHATLAGQALPSELAHFVMFGYPPALFPGRGILEAVGQGLDPAPEDVALMARLVSVQPEQGCLRMLHDTPPQLDAAAVRALCAALPQTAHAGLRFRFHHAKDVHGVLLIQGGGSPLLTDTNPIRDGAMLIAPQPLAEARQRGEEAEAWRTARALAAYLRACYTALRAHPVNIARAARRLPPANALATQRAGRLTAIPPFAEHNGLRGLCIASGALFRGLAQVVGLEFLAVPDTSAPGTDLARRLELAYAALRDYDWVHVHTKAPDQAAHTKDPLRKREVIAALDAGAAPLLARLMQDPDLLLVLTADHSTPSSGPLIHSGEPVPLVLHGQGLRRDAVTGFDEVQAATGALGYLRGAELMLTMLNHLELARLQGLRDNPADLAAWPAAYEPFALAAPETEGPS